jgi:hypothetical protein
VKMSRVLIGGQSSDDYVDGAAYMAMAESLAG